MVVALRELLHGAAFSVCALVVDGACETEAFLAVAERERADDWASMLALLERAANHGPPRNVEKSRDVGGGLLEFKAKSLRICWFYDAGRLIVCTHGFLKPTKKVQNREFRRAMALRNAYFEAKARGRIPFESEEPEK